MKAKNYLLLLFLLLLHPIVYSQTTATGREVMMQGFHWTTDVSTTKWYDVIKSNSTALQTGGFDAIWLPPPSKSTGGMGYIPTVWYDLNNAHGTQAQLTSLITDLHSKNIKVIADIVVNHRGGTTGWYDFSTPSWNTPTQTWSICNNSNISPSGQKGTGNPDYDPVQAGLKSPGTSGLFSAGRDLDHSNVEVRNGIKTWMLWLKNQIGFDGWRYDFVHGFDGKYIKEYNDATSPYFSVGELLEGDRNRIVKWLDYTKGGTNTASSTAFDFATKSALQNAFNDNNLSYLKDGSGKASGLIGVWPDKAVTMLDNHDTGPVPYGQDLWIFPGSKVLNGYAYILTHPGTPMVWWPHYFNWGIKSQIDAMIKIRKDNLLTNTSTLNIVAASNNLYAAIIDNKVAMKLGSDNWSPSGTGWTLKLSGTGFAIWDKASVVDVPSLTVSQVGGFFTTGTTVNTTLTANTSTSTIYYALDGTTPTIASPSAVGSVTLSINSTKTLNAFVRNTVGVNSTIRTETYTFGTLPTFTVYFKKPANWNSAVKVYYWSPTGTAPTVAWPGVAMTKDCGDWYKFTFPSTVSATNLIFNDGTLKTADLATTAGIKYYDSAWLAGEPANRCPTQTTMTVYFKPPTNWTTIPKIHYWNPIPAGSVANTTWPGVAMVADVNGFYKYTITGPTSINLIFNNGSSGTANQTPDLLNNTNGFSYSWGTTTAKVTLNKELKTEDTIISVYPNPVSSLLYINSSSPVLNYKIQDMNGIQVKYGKSNNNAIDMSYLNNGIYIIHIRFENGQELKQKIIKN